MDIGRINPTELFSPKEIIIFKYILKGLRNKEIGHVLGNSERTIDTHRDHIYKKIRKVTGWQYLNLVDLVRFGIEYGSVSVSDIGRSRTNLPLVDKPVPFVVPIIIKANRVSEYAIELRDLIELLQAKLYMEISKY